MVGRYAILSTTGFAKLVPLGPKSNGVPFTTRGSLAKVLEAVTDRLVVEPSAAGGTTI